MGLAHLPEHRYRVCHFNFRGDDGGSQANLA